jgi:hypothetical protein
VSKSIWLKDEDQKGNFSNQKQDTFDPGKGYLGIRLQQGSPLLDRDWNELEDIRRYAGVMLRKYFIGNGVPDENGFRIEAADTLANDFKIFAGRCLVEGFEVVNEPVDTDGTPLDFILYSQQEGVEPLSVPDVDRSDTVYLDVWIEEVTGQQEAALNNPQDVNVETCTRHKLNWRVKVNKGIQELPGEAFHHYYPIARIQRRAGKNTLESGDIIDLRLVGLALHLLTNQSNADGKHKHSKLAAPDGTPDPALIVDINGKVGIGTTEPAATLDVNGDIRANNFYKLLPHNIISNSFMNRLKGNVPSGFNIGSYRAGNSTMQIEAVHPFTKGFEGPYVESKPENAVDNVDDATGSNPYWFGRYWKGPRAARGGLGDGWMGRFDGQILKITGRRDAAESISNIYVMFPKERRILTARLLFRAWVKITKGAIDFGTDVNVYPQITRAMTETAPQGWYFINRIFDSSHVTDIGEYSFIFKCLGEEEDHEGDFEIYLALPYLANIEKENSPHWSPSILDILSDYGTTIDLDNGNVGIGNTKPWYKLDINGGSNYPINAVTSQRYIMRMSHVDDIGGGWLFVNEPNKFFAICENSGGDRLIIKDGGNVGIGTTEPGARLDVIGAIFAGNSDIYFTKTDHDHSGIGNTPGYAAIENARNYEALMILGRATYPGGVLTRVVQLWDYLEVHGKLHVQNWGTVGSDYAEYFESKDGKAIPPGTTVVLENGKVRRANKNETPMGIISANPGMAGGVHVEWPKKYLKDEFGNQIMEEYKEEIMVPKKEKVKKERQRMEKKKVKEKVKRTEVVKKKGKYYQVEAEETVERDIEELVFKEIDLYDDVSKKKIGKHKIPVMETYEEEIDVLDENGQPVMVGSGKFETKTRPKINPDYDEKKEYIFREKRPEWNCVGLLGQLPLRKGQPVAPTWIKIKDISKEVELWLVK